MTLNMLQRHIEENYRLHPLLVTPKSVEVLPSGSVRVLFQLPGNKEGAVTFGMMPRPEAYTMAHQLAKDLHLGVVVAS